MTSQIKLWLIGTLVVAIAAAAFAWRNSLITAEQARAASAAGRDFRSTTQRMGDADVGKGDADDNLRWLYDRMQRRSGQR